MKKNVCPNCLIDGKLVEMKAKGKMLICNKCGKVVDTDLFEREKEKKEKATSKRIWKEFREYARAQAKYWKARNKKDGI